MRYLLYLLIIQSPLIVFSQPEDLTELTITYGGTCLSHVKENREIIQKYSRYKDMVSDNKFHEELSIADVEQYYDDMQNNREYPVEITSSKNNDGYRLSYSSPKGGFRFYTPLEE